MTPDEMLKLALNQGLKTRKERTHSIEEIRNQIIGPDMITRTILRLLRIRPANSKLRSFQGNLETKNDHSHFFKMNTRGKHCIVEACEVCRSGKKKTTEETHVSVDDSQETLPATHRLTFLKTCEQCMLKSSHHEHSDNFVLPSTLARINEIARHTLRRSSAASKSIQKIKT